MDFINHNHFVVEGHPEKDMFGTPLIEGDMYLIDEQGRVVFQQNVREYLIEVHGVVFYEVKL